ncbi:hypothetical protein TNCV_1819881, partial [Trichonephila clavipes]
RERLSLTTLETADGTSDDVGTEEEHADQTLLAVLRQVPREADPNTSLQIPVAYRRSSQSPGRRSEENSRRATFQGGGGRVYWKPSSTAKMTGNQLDVIIDKKPIRALVDSGASFSSYPISIADF